MMATYGISRIHPSIQALLLFLFSVLSASSSPPGNPSHPRHSLLHLLRHHLHSRQPTRLQHSFAPYLPDEDDLDHRPSYSLPPQVLHVKSHQGEVPELFATAQQPTVAKTRYESRSHLRSTVGGDVSPLLSPSSQHPASLPPHPNVPQPSQASRKDENHPGSSEAVYGTGIEPGNDRSMWPQTQSALAFVIRHPTPSDSERGMTESLSSPPSSDLRRLREASSAVSGGGRSRPAEPIWRPEPEDSSFAAPEESQESVPLPLPLFEPGVERTTSSPEHLHLPTPPLSSSSSESRSSSTIQSPVVTTDCGDVMGFWIGVSTGGRVASFLGIPYSEPPVGDLRFRAPVPVSPWRKTKEATKFGPLCIQPGNQFVWDAVRFPSPTTPTPQHQTVRPKHIRQSSQQKDAKKDDKTFQFPEPSILFSALIADRPTPLGISDSDNETFPMPAVVFPTTSAMERETVSTAHGWSVDSQLTAATEQIPSAPVMRRRRMRNYEMSEDCLTLNIYTPQLHSNESNGGLPILFFIHGGSYYMNGGRLYPGEELAARGAVVVTFNYRLGPFGFLSTGEPSCRGNWGLLDQVEALRWVRRNANVFGGDAHNSLCLVGNSAGAASVLLHMVSPVTKGLFSCAVAMSGCSGAPWAIQPRPLRHAKSLATRLGCPHPNRRPHHAVACLRTFSAQLIAENSDLEDGLGVAFAPVVDGVGVGGVGGGRRGAEGSEGGTAPGNGPFIPDDPRRLMAEGKFAQVPFLSGLTRDEVSIWFSNFGPTMEKRMMRVFLEKDIKQLLNGTGLPALNSFALSHAAAHLYLWGSRGEIGAEEARVAEGHRASEGVRGYDPGSRGSTLAVADFISDVGLKAPCIYDMELIARSNQKPSFFYEFQYHSVDDARTDKQEWIGAYHESELQFLFGEPFLGFSNHLRSANDKEVSEMVMSLWINFAKHGHPTPDRGSNAVHGNVDWQPFTSTHRQYLVLGYRPRMAENYLTERMVFWNYIADAFRRHPMPPFCTTPPATDPPMVNLPLPPSDHLRWIFWTMAAGNALFVLTMLLCVAKRLRRRARSPTNRSATSGV